MRSPGIWRASSTPTKAISVRTCSGHSGSAACTSLLVSAGTCENYLMPLADKIMLRKRFVIETVLDTLKSEMGLEHSRHRSPVNAMVHVLSCLVAYAFRPGKPSISLNSKHLQAYP